MSAGHERSGSDGASVIASYAAPTADAETMAGYQAMVVRLREFLDAVAVARPDPEVVAGLEATLADWSRRLEAAAVPERERLHGRVKRVPGRGNAFVPVFTMTGRSSDHIEGSVRFGDFHMGTNGVVHGGAVSLVFDDLLGNVAHRGDRRPSRTAYLHTDFRAPAPINVDLAVRCWLERVEGRKITVRGTLHHGEVLCSEVEALFVELRPGQV